MLFKSTLWVFVVCSGPATTTGQVEVVGPTKPIVALEGDDVVLPCQLKPSGSAVNTLVEWTRPDLQPVYVHVLQDGRPQTDLQNPSFTERTALFTKELKNGNVSLKLSRVRLSDEGRYRCFLPFLGIQVDPLVHLIVGVVGQPVVSIMEIQGEGVVLQCESGGWHPQPEVEWLDSEGHVLSAGPTETLKDPDGTYTVRRNVTVEKTATNRFTCRVQQRHINQTRETEIRIPGAVFGKHSTSFIDGVIGFFVGITVGITAAVAAILLYKRKVSKEKQPKTSENGQKQTGRDTEVCNPLLSKDQTPKTRTEEDLESVISGSQPLNLGVERDPKKPLENMRSQLVDKDTAIKTLEGEKAELQSRLGDIDRQAKTLEEEVVKLKSISYGQEVKLLLLLTLIELKSRKIDLKKFQEHLCTTRFEDHPIIQKDRLKNANMATTVDVMLEHNQDGALCVTTEILRSINQKDLIEKLEEKLPPSQRMRLQHRRLLLNTLEQLKDKEQKKFKERLQQNVPDGFDPIPEKELMNANVLNTVDMMVRAYEPEAALVIARDILKEMKLDKLVKSLEAFQSHSSSTPAGEGAEAVQGLTPARPNPDSTTDAGLDPRSLHEVKGQRSPSDQGDTGS